MAKCSATAAMSEQETVGIPSLIFRLAESVNSANFHNAVIRQQLCG